MIIYPMMAYNRYLIFLRMKLIVKSMMVCTFTLFCFFSTEIRSEKNRTKQKTIRTYTFSHAAFDTLLQLNVKNGEPYYDGFDDASFHSYCDSLSLRPYNTIPAKERSAFWLNAVNSCIIRAVLLRHGMRSVANFSDFYTKDTFSICGIQKNIRGFIDTAIILNSDPLFSFGIFLGTKSFPGLLNRAYHYATINTKLKMQARKFLRSEYGAVLDIRANVLSISPFFNYYSGYWNNEEKKKLLFIRQFLTEESKNFCIVNAESLKLSILPENMLLLYRNSASKMLKIRQYGD